MLTLFFQLLCFCTEQKRRRERNTRPQKVASNRTVKLWIPDFMCTHGVIQRATQHDLHIMKDLTEIMSKKQQLCGAE